MRLQRGKLALREALTTTCRDDALAYGLIREDKAGWRATRIWCPHCGAVRLRGRFGERGGRPETSMAWTSLRAWRPPMTSLSGRRRASPGSRMPAIESGTFLM
jgi:hypothetical protein